MNNTIMKDGLFLGLDLAYNSIPLLRLNFQSSI